MPITLKAARVNKGLSQTQAAEQLKLHSDRSYTKDIISNWERCLTFPDVIDIKAIEEVYGVGYNDLNFYPENTVKP